MREIYVYKMPQFLFKTQYFNTATSTINILLKQGNCLKENHSTHNLCELFKVFYLIFYKLCEWKNKKK